VSTLTRGMVEQQAQTPHTCHTVATRPTGGGGVTDSFADVLRRCRRGSGMSQAALAESAGLSASAVSALERGERTRPYPHTVRVMAEAMTLSEADRQELLAAAASGSGARLFAPVGGSVVPVPLTSFVGRQELIVLGTKLITQERLITLTGLGGVGKTRLAVELSRRTAETFAGGRWTVDVESLAGATSVTESAAAVLGLRDPPEADHIDSLAVLTTDVGNADVLDMRKTSE